MADVFLSYRNTPDRRSYVKRLATVLRAHEISVWWDYGLEAGEGYRPQILAELSAAKVVAPLWCEESIVSKWVNMEAELGRDKLVPARLQRVVAPDAFEAIQAADLIDWGGEVNHPRLLSYVATIAKRVGKSANAPLDFIEELGDLPRLPPLSMRAKVDAPPHAASSMAPGVEFRDGDGLPLMVVVPQGAVVPTRGRRTVMPAPLAVGKYPVLVGEWRRFVEATGFETGSGVHAWNGKQWIKVHDRDWRAPGFPQDDTHPVTCIDWGEANAYCAWLSGTTAQTYRLLTDDEWEYACRGRAITTYASGDTIGPEHANFAFHNRGTTRAGAYPANGFGLCDMHGNVWEWTNDEYPDTAHAVRSVAGTRRSPLGEGGTPNAARGGSWANDTGELKADTRFRFSRTSRSDILGFRVAREIAS